MTSTRIFFDRAFHVVPWLALLAFAVLVLMGERSADAQEGAVARNPRLFAVPRTSEITIDGELTDWDTSAGIVSFPAETLKDERRITTYAMYDDEAFYLAGRVHDDTPMMNRHDPRTTPGKAWDADAFQFRMYLKPRFPGDETKFGEPKTHHESVHLTMWYYTDRKEPNLQLFYSMAYAPPQRDWPDGVVPHEKFDAAYRKWDDGTGYTFEYRIPWDTLSKAHRPDAGDVTAANIQVQWGRSDGLKSLGSEGWVKDLMREGGFPFQSSAVWGKLIFSKHGNLPGGMAEGVGGEESVKRPTPLSLKYDLPRAGHVSLGLYDQQNVLRRQLLAEAQREAGTITEPWDGLDDHGEPLEPGTYTWRGLVSDPITTEFILSVHNSGTPPHKTNDGTGGWGGDHGTPTDVAAIGGAQPRMLLAWSAAESGWGIIRTDLSGDKQWGSKHTTKHLAVSADGKRLFTAGGHGFSKQGGVRVYDVADSRPLNFGSGEPTAALPDFDESQDQEETVSNVTGVVAHDDRLYVSFGERDVIAVNHSDSGALLTTWAVDAPGPLAIGQDGALLAISGGRVVEVRDGEATLLAEAHLDEPKGIAVDAAGRIYVTNQGALHNVSVFSSDGKYLKSIGKQGGRARIGRFEPGGMLAPGGCAIDADGRLWVAETRDRPKRISVWDTDTGENVDQFFGGSSYFGWAWMDPEKPGEVYSHSVLWKIDLDKRTKRIHSTIWRQVGDNTVPPPRTGGYRGHFRVFTADNGRQFGFGGTGGGNVLYMRAGDIYKPIAGMVAADGEKYPALKEMLAKQHKKWDEQGLRNWKRAHNLFWQDANDDQAVQLSEVTIPPKAHRRTSFFHWVGKDLSAWNARGTMIAPTRFDGDRPIYDFTNLQATPLGERMKNLGKLWFDDRHADGIYRVKADTPHSLSKWSVDGELLWSTGKRLRWHKALGHPVMKPGDIWGMTTPLTLAGEFTGVATYFGGYHVFTRDGLYVAMLMRPGRAGGGLGPDITASETLTGQLVKPTGMNRHFLLAGDQDGRVTEVHGLNTITRLEGGSITLTSKDVDKVRDAQRNYQSAKQSAGVLFVQRGKASLDSEHGTVGNSVDGDREWQAQLAHDQTHLHVRYEIKSPSPLINNVSDPQMIYKGGNLMDVQLATDPEADAQRQEPAAGDVRLLISRRPDGTPVAVLLRPEVKGFEGDPIVLRSPTGEESFDKIEAIDGIDLKYEKTDAGFVATARVPLKSLGWSPVSGRTWRADVGYVFGNKTGTRASARSYWHNNSFSANVTDDIPHESRLQPHEWGAAVVE